MPNIRKITDEHEINGETLNLFPLSKNQATPRHIVKISAKKVVIGIQEILRSAKDG